MLNYRSLFFKQEIRGLKAFAFSFITVNDEHMKPTTRDRGREEGAGVVKMQVLEKNPLNITSPSILRNLDNFPSSAFYSTPSPLPPYNQARRSRG